LYRLSKKSIIEPQSQVNDTAYQQAKPSVFSIKNIAEQNCNNTTKQYRVKDRLYRLHILGMW